MSYAPIPSTPRYAPNSVDGPRFATAAMPRRHHHASDASARTLTALAALDISCDCKCSLIVSCAVGAKPGCRERQHEGICGCKPRWLPTCILDAQTPHGCGLWREGKTCSCERLYMPRCLVTGCDVRRKGKRCECPRTPTELCPHLKAKLREFASLDFDEANGMANAWADQLWTLLPDQYADRPLASRGCKTKTQESTVGVMAVRESLGLSLWHHEDERGHLDTMMRKQAAGLKRLLGLGGKGSAA